MNKKDNYSLKKLLSRISKYFCFVVNNIKRKIPAKTLKIIIKAFLIFGIGIISIFLFLNKDNLSPDQIMIWFSDKTATWGKGPEFPTYIIGNKISDGNFKLMDGSLSIVSDTTFSCLNNSAHEIANRQHGFSNPVLKVNGNRAAIYDLYGTGLEITSKSKQIQKITTKENILAAAVASNGTYGTVTQTKGFAGKLELFKKGTTDSFFEYSFADCYITDMAFSKNGKSIGAVGVTSKDGGMLSTLYIFDGKNENAKFKLDFPDSMIFSINYLSNGNIVVIGDNMLSVVNASNGKKQDYDFENKVLTSFDVNPDKGVLLSLSLSDDGNFCELLVFDKKGNVIKGIKTDLKVKAVSYNYDRIAAISYGYTYVYKKNGTFLNKYDSGKDAKKIVLFSSKGAYVLGFTEIRKVLF